uniref:Integrase catalytic domain-containing protein n=1 Tax=Tanacetum cinerariifolium TaxID=118510 RepID=A0A6L2MU72_TANCI|nr:hypothetical protein [Tanacetum cinerariifolium]
MVDSQPIEEEFQEVATRDSGTETHRGPTEPVLQTQKTPFPSSAFIKENIDVLRTMIKEHDHQAKMKATPRKLAYADFDKKAPVKQTRSTIKSQKTPSKNTKPTHLRKLRRLEDRSTTKENARRERSKSRRKRSEHQEMSSDFEHEEGSDDAFEDLNSPYKRPKPTPFTQRITHFKYHKRAKLPWNVRNEGLQAFIDRFKFESSHIKGVPPVLHILAFMHGHSHPELAKKLNDRIPKTVDGMFERVRALIRGEVAAESAEMVILLKETNDMKDTFTPLTKILKEILAIESVNFLEPLPLIKTLEKQNLNKFCNYHGDRGHNTNDYYQLKKQIEEVVASKKICSSSEGHPPKQPAGILEEGEELAYLMGYPYKCFLQLPKECSKIKMVEENEVKTGFHMKERAYCFTHMPKELKNSTTTLQMMMEKLVEIILFIIDSGCSKHMTGNLKLLTSFVEKFLGSLKFGNDQIAPILGYGDLVQGTVTIKRVYYVEGLNHNLFFISQFYDANLEVAFLKSTCYIRVLKGNDLLTGSHGTDLYSITLQDTSSPNPIYLMAKLTSSQAWLWHRRLSHLNFDTINLLSKNDIVIGLPKLKFVKDHLCSTCELGKAKRKSFQIKTTPNSKRRLHLLHIDLCGPMRVESINGRKYVLVIVDDYSRYTCTHFLRSKDETPEVLIDFLRLVQRGLHAQVRIVRTDKGTKFLNITLHAYFVSEEIQHQTSVARTPKQNGVVERRNRTLVEAARTMLSAAKVPLFFWAEVIATSCFTQNRSLVIPRHEKTPYHIINDRKPSVKFFYTFGTLCYIVRDGENIYKMKEKGDACIFVGYSTQSRAYRVFNKRTRVIFETIHVNFDELPQMASDHVKNVPPLAGTVTTSNELDLLFSPMIDELLNGSTQVVSKSYDVTTADAPNKCQQQHTTPLNTQTTLEPTCQVPSQAPTVTSTKNINQAKTITKNAQVKDDEFINIFCTPVQDRGETSSRHADSSNMHTFYQRHPSEHRWTKDHPLEQEEVYVNQPDGFVDPYHPDKVYRFKKALYGLKQAPMSWYDELSNFLVSKGFSKGIQIHQSPRGIFINQSKYAQEILIKHGMNSCDSIGTSMATKHLDADLSGTLVDQTKYQSIFKALMYLTASRPDIMHATCSCARYQAKPTKKHLTAVKRIFWTALQYLQQKPTIAISYNPVQHSRTKHIDVRYHFIKEKVEKGIIELFFVETEYQLADLFTKALSEDRFKCLVR